ncbi:MAG: NADPH-dependent FMN reductase [Chloroflexi bacterium]|nr:NADPH-dependent FMN reductase [Chloroflexota bacterium]
MANILIINGSPIAPSRTGALMGYCADFIQRQWHTTTTVRIDVRELDPVELTHGRFDGGSIMAAAALVGEAEGIILGTPVYKNSFAGVLKAFLDILPQGAFSGKVVLPIVLGGAAAHALAIDYALLPVFAALNAYHTLHGVFLIENQVELLDGRLSSFTAPEAEHRIDAALEQFILAVRRTRI